MRPFIRRQLPLALSLLLLSVLGACGLGLMHGSSARVDAQAVTARLRHLCAPQHTVCGQVVPGVLGATLLIGMVRVRDGLGEASALAATNAQPGDEVDQTTTASTAPTNAETLLGLMALVVAFCCIVVPQRITRMAALAQALPTRSIPAHFCTPAP